MSMLIAFFALILLGIVFLPILAALLMMIFAAGLAAFSEAWFILREIFKK